MRIKYKRGNEVCVIAGKYDSFWETNYEHKYWRVNENNEINWFCFKTEWNHNGYDVRNLSEKDFKDFGYLTYNDLENMYKIMLRQLKLNRIL